MGEPLADLMAENPRPEASVVLFDKMMADIMAGGNCADPMGQVRPRPAPQLHMSFSCT